MFVSAESATTIVRLAGRFDAPQARSLEEILSMFRPVRHVVIDFGNVREADDAAVANLARTLVALRESRVTFRGLSKHLRRVLLYMGVRADEPSDTSRPPAFGAQTTVPSDG
jgi:anti-anti-sigma regulatory factor